MGLLDAFYTQGSAPPNPDATFPQLLSSPMGQGLLGALAGYAANARRGAPVNSIGRGLLGGLAAYGGAQERDAKLAEEQQQRQLRTMQMNQLQASLADQEQAKKTAAQYFRPAVPAIGALDSSLPPEFQTGAVPMPAKPAGFDLHGFANARMAQNPLDGMKLLAEIQRETPFNKVDPDKFTPDSLAKFAQTKNWGDLVPRNKLHFADNGGSLVGLDEYTGQQRSTSPKTGNPYSDLLVAGANGPVPNQPLIAAKTQIAKAGATNVSTKIENKMGEGIAAQVGPMLKDSYTQANGAVGTIDAANRVIGAVDSGNIFVGPGANTKMKLAQWADVLGVAGKDTNEKIGNTRQAIRGFAEMTMQGRKQMTGQGQITDAEQALAQKASSGDIEDLTASEVKQLANASKRYAQFLYDQHQQNIGYLSQDPNTAGLAKFYKPLPLPQSATSPKRPQVPQPTPQPGPGVRFLGFE